VSAKHLPDLGRLAGLVTSAELAAGGITESGTRNLVRRRILVPVCRGIYARAELAGLLTQDARGEHLLRVAAAVAVAGPRSAVSHQDAAIIHGIDMLAHPPAGVVAVTRPPSIAGTRTARPGIAMHIASLPPGQVTSRDGIRVTSVARTVVDLARNTSFRSGVVVADSALHANRTSKAELQSVIQACARWPGIQRAREVVEFADARSESVFESISRVVFREQRLPPPELQVWVGEDGLVVGRVDFLWPVYRTVAEADGAVKYSNPDRARLQLQRDAGLRAAGFEVVHFTWKELHLAAGQVAQEIRAAFRRGASR
jgi:very-short-patch-repair endonuclease